MVLAGLSPDGRLVEVIELQDHPWFVGSQFHPEFKSRPERPHPLFRDFVGAARERYQMDQEIELVAPPRVETVEVAAPVQS